MKKLGRLVRMLLVFSMILTVSQARYSEIVRADENEVIKSNGGYLEVTNTFIGNDSHLPDGFRIEVKDENGSVAATLDLSNNEPNASSSDTYRWKVQLPNGEYTVSEVNADQIADYQLIETTMDQSKVLISDNSVAIEIVNKYDFIVVEEKNEYQDEPVISEEILDTNKKNHKPVPSVWTMTNSTYASTNEENGSQGAPEIEKTLTANADGSYTIALDIQGSSDQEVITSKVDVIFILDRSGSMRYGISDMEEADKPNRRIDKVSSAANTLINSLVKDETIDVRFSLVTFSGLDRTAITTNWPETEDSTNADRVKNAISNIEPNGGTNYEAGIYKAETLVASAREDAKVVVVFLTDGIPTYYGIKSQSGAGNVDGDYTYRGVVQNPGSCSRAAINRVKELGCDLFYAVGVGPDFSEETGDGRTNLVNLAANAGTNSNVTTPEKVGVYSATDTTSLNNAFSSISGSIKDMMTSEIVVKDGITSLANLSAKVSGTTSGFRYYKNGETWTTAPTAQFVDGKVVWDLSSITDEANTVYTLEFDVWPTQEALDTIAKLNNGDLTEYDHDQIYLGEDGKYYLKTNTSLSATYQYNNQTGEKTDYNYDVKPGIELVTTEFAIEKVWNNLTGDGKGASDIVLNIYADGSFFTQVDFPAGTTVKNGIHIAPGVIQNGVVLETGHDYTIVETGANAYNWQLNAPVYHPMIIDGVVTMLVKDTNGTMTIGNQKYSVVSSSNTTLTAVNDRRSNLNITKVLTETSTLADPNQLFEFTLRVDDPQQQDIYFSIWDGTNYVTGLNIANATASSDYYVVASGTTVTVSLKAGWNLRVINLLTSTTYCVTESTTMPDGYHFVSVTSNTTNTINGTSVQGTIDESNQSYQVTYTNEYQVQNVTVNKIWDDNSDQDGVRPTSVQFQLYANGTAYLQPFTLTAENQLTNNQWSKTFENLPAYINNTAVVYTVVETDDLSGIYTTTYSADHLTVTNTHIPETKTIHVSKVWNDANNQDGFRPDKVTVRLFANGNEINHVELSENNQWTASFEALAIKANGNTINYRISEDAVSYYQTEIKETIENEYTITNTHTPETTSVSVNKVWNDANNQDGIRPTSVTINLLADGLTTGKTLVLSADNNWTGSFTNLDKYAEGTAIVYTVTEDSVTGYTTTIDAINNGYTVTNTHTPETTSVSVNKVWNDANNQDGIRPDSVTIQLVVNGTTTNQTITLSANNNWSGSFTDLAKYAAGQEIVYTVTEVEVNGYTAAITGSAESGYTVTNTHTPETTSVSVNKIWNDANNQDGIRPTVLNVTLFADGVKVADYQLTAEKNYALTINDLTKYANGQLIVYTWTEQQVNGYQSSTNVVGNTTTFTNTHTPEVTSATVIKQWNDANNQDGIRPASLEVELYANAVATGTKVLLTAQDNWSKTINQLAKYADGVEITYTFVETAVEGYRLTEASSNGSTTTLTNTHTPATQDLTVIKVWEDANNQDGYRPTSIEVELYANGVATGKKATLTAGNNWTATIQGLNVNENGQPIRYTWQEATIAHYVMTGNTTVGTTTTITNTHETEKTSVSVNKVWVDANNQDGLRPTSLEVYLYANNQLIQTIELSDNNNWTATVRGLDAKANGSVINYRFDEATVEGYTASKAVQGNVTTFTNTHEIIKTSSTVTKVWEDNNNADGNRPASLLVTLCANGTATTTTATLTAENSYSVTIEDLDKYANGTEIAYSWQETLTAEAVMMGYSQKSVETSNNNTVITNTYQAVLTEATVEKVWEDNNNADGNRPTSITVTLTLNGQPTSQSYQLSAENGWKYTVSGLAKYTGTTENVYGFTEELTALDKTLGYSLKSITTANGITTIVNQYQAVLVSVDVFKVWNDNNNADGNRPDSLLVTLYVNGTATGITRTLLASAWTAEVTGLKKYTNRVENRYTWEETLTAEAQAMGYSQISNTTTGTTTTIVNGYESVVTEVSVEKEWEDDNNADGNRPAALTVSLYINGQLSDVRVELNEQNGWKATVTNLPVYTDGQTNEYTWEETLTAEAQTLGYYEKSNVTEGYQTTITNGYEAVLTEATVMKSWDDNENQDGIRPEELIVYLTLNGEKTEQFVTLTKENQYQATIEGLNVYLDGEAVTYGWEEEEIEGYELTTTETNQTVTVLTNYHEPSKISITVEKQWANDSEEVRPNEITVQLLKNGEAYLEAVVITADEEGNWSYTFEQLDEYENEGTKIEYTVEEEAVENYLTKITGSQEEGYIITNTYNLRDVAVVKVWVEKITDKYRPESILVELYADGELIDKREIGEADEWVTVFEGLPYYKEKISDDGEVVYQEINYTIEEQEVERYSTEIEGDMEVGFMITNTLESSYDVPETGDNNLPVISLFTSITSFATLVYVVILKKKSLREEDFA